VAATDGETHALPPNPTLPMTGSPSTFRAAFLDEVRRRVSPRYRQVAFDEIIDALIEWSLVPSRRLDFRAPGKQHTVSFGVDKTGDVLWAAYPRRDDGAKVVILPRRFRLLPAGVQSDLISRQSAVAPSVRVGGTETLECPMHLLASDRVLAGYRDLLSEAHQASLHAHVG
jgi:hypothetical protein